MFPFHYQPQTTMIEWFRRFTFDIDVIRTGVVIDELELTDGAYALGGPVTGTAWLDNIGRPLDVVAAVSVRNAASGRAIDGLDLRVLHNLQGPSSYAFEWDSSGLPSGQYAMVVEVKDTDGNLLDSRWEEFGLGLADAEIVNFSAAPELFRPGEAVTVSLRVANSGGITLSGTALVEVQTADGMTTTEVFRHSVSNLAPSAARSFQDVWDTTGTTEGDYRVIGYFKYEGGATDIETVQLTTLRRVYLPVVLK